MSTSNETKNEALGMNFSTASAQLKKNLMFKFMQVLNLDQCFQCGEVIDAVDQLSVEHKQPWLSAPDPKAAFFDLNNIAFSHLSCNVGARTNKPRTVEIDANYYRERWHRLGYANLRRDRRHQTSVAQR